MALSNIRREPRREITETLLGILTAVSVVGILCGMGYPITRMFLLHIHGTRDLIGCSLFCGIIAIGGSYLVLVWFHALGEITADALAKRGLELRPRKRY